jgi:hypothetical protein
MLHSSQPPDFDHPNIIWQRARVTESLCSFLHSPVISFPLNSKYSPQHPVLKHPQCVLFTVDGRSGYTLIQNNK